MNIDFKRENFMFNARTSAVIYNKDKDKVLLFNVSGRKVNLLPGGRIAELEKSEDTIKREVKEELGFNNLKFEFLALSEEFVFDKGYNCQQLNIIYQAVYDEEIKELEFKGLEEDWINFKWVDIKDIDSYNIYPSKIKDIISKKTSTNHFIEDIIEETRK